jgi:hypothetical protein
MSSQYYSATAYVGTPHRNAVEVTVPLVGPQGPAGEAGAGAVESVNGQTGVVVLAAADVGAAATSHTHGNITNAGLVGTTSGLPLKTGTGGIVEAGAFGTTAGQFAEGNHTHAVFPSLRIDPQNAGVGSLIVGSTTGSAADIITLDGIAGIKLLAQGGQYTATINRPSIGADRTYDLPNASGTLALTQQSSDMEITDSTKGIILKSANNTRWRITINDDGTLSRAALALMTLLAFATSGMAQVRDMVTDTNGNIITGRTNELTFTNNLRFGTLTNANAQTAIIGTNGALSAGSVPSGAATSGSVLTAAGDGSSSFVASKVTTVALTNDFAVTNTTDMSAAANSVTGMTVTLDANSLYVARWWVLITCGAEGAKLEMIAGAGTNGIRSQPLASRIGRPNLSFADTYFTVAGGQVTASLLGASGAGFTSGTTNGQFVGFGQFRTGISNTTLFWRFTQNSASNVATTILSNSYFQVEKLGP